MNWSQKRRAVLSRATIALFQGAVVLGFGGCGVPEGNIPGEDTPLEYTCTRSSDCPSGYCSDGVCCNSSCDIPCNSCNIVGSIGTCSPLPKFSEDLGPIWTCTSPGQCDGEGKCRQPIGNECNWNGHCWSGFCADDICCESACDQACMTCNESGMCVPTPAMVADNDCPEHYGTCNGNGQCILALGQSCTDETTCLSGFCVDNVCCDSACTESCKGCGVPGSVGMCISLPAYENDPNAAVPCAGPTSTCNGAGECKTDNDVACTMNSQCASGSCSNGTCQTPPPQPGPLQWLWSNDQTVCKNPNGFDRYENKYPNVFVERIVARDDESVFGVGQYTLPSQGLTSQYGEYLGLGQINREGPHTFKLDVASGGASALWSTVDFYSLLVEVFKVCEAGPFTWTEFVGPLIETAGDDIVFYRQNHSVRLCAGETSSFCKFGELSKLAAPQWTLGTSDICTHEEFAFAGDAAGNVVTRADDRLKKYDPSGAVVLDLPTPFNFGPTILALSATGNIHAAEYSSTAIHLARTNPSGTLAWAKTFTIANPIEHPPTIDLSVDALGNSIIAFYAYGAMDLGNGPVPTIGAKDLVLAKFDVQGNVLWAKRMGSGNFAPITVSMRKTGANDLALLVHFTGVINLGDGLLQSSPVLVKYDANGNFVWRADLLPLYPAPGTEVSSMAIAGHPSGAVFVSGTGYGLASSTAEPFCDLGAAPNGDQYLPGTFPRPLRMFAAKYGP